MQESDQRTIFDKLFGNGGFVYPIGEDGKPDYGFVSFGPREIRVVNVTIYNMDGKLVEALELEDGNILRGREVEIGGQDGTLI